MKFFHKMRRTGFKKEDLTYYCYEQGKDFLQGLTEKIVSDLLTNTAFKKFKREEKRDFREKVHGLGYRERDSAERFQRRLRLTPAKPFLFSRFFTHIGVFLLI